MPMAQTEPGYAFSESDAVIKASDKQLCEEIKQALQLQTSHPHATGCMSLHQEAMRSGHEYFLGRATEAIEGMQAFFDSTKVPEKSPQTREGNNMLQDLQSGFGAEAGSTVRRDSVDRSKAWSLEGLQASPFGNQQSPFVSWTNRPVPGNPPRSKGSAIQPPKRIRLFGTWVEPSTADREERLDAGKGSQQQGERPELLKRAPSPAQNNLVNLKLQQGPGGARLYGGAKDPTGGGMGFFHTASFWKKKAPEPAGGASESKLVLEHSPSAGSGDAVFEKAKEQTRQLMHLFGGNLTQRGGDLSAPTVQEQGISLPVEQPGKQSSSATASDPALAPADSILRPWPSVGVKGFKTDSRDWVLTAAPPDALRIGRANSDAAESLQRVLSGSFAKQETNADATAAQAAYELMALARAQADGQAMHPTSKQTDASREEIPPATTPGSESCSSVVVPVKVPSPGLISDDDQPLAHRQNGSVHGGKAFKNLQLQRPPSGKKVASSNLNGGASKDVSVVTTDDRCNYHSGKAKMGWRCKNPKLKGFKICKFHRKQRLDRRKQLSNAQPALTTEASVPEKGAEAVVLMKENLLPKKKTETSTSVPRPPKKRPHVFVEDSVKGSSDPETNPPPKKKRSALSPRKRSDGLKEARPEGSGQTRVQEDIEESADALKYKVGTGGLDLPFVELSDDKRCTYRSGAQGKWRCKRPRHESFKFCHFHRESQKKYWNKKNQARRLADKK